LSNRPITGCFHQKVAEECNGAAGTRQGRTGSHPDGDRVAIVAARSSVSGDSIPRGGCRSAASERVPAVRGAAPGAIGARCSTGMWPAPRARSRQRRWQSGARAS